MSLSQRRRWQEDFARLQAQFQLRSQIPIDRRRPGLVEGVKAGLVLVALSTPAVAADIYLNKEAYNDAGVKIIGTLTVPSVQASCVEEAGEGYIQRVVNTPVATWQDALTVVVYIRTTNLVTVELRHSCNANTARFRVMEDAVEKIAPQAIAVAQTDYSQTFTPTVGSRTLRIQVDDNGTSGAHFVQMRPHSGTGQLGFYQA